MEYTSKEHFRIDHELYASSYQRFANYAVDYIVKSGILFGFGAFAALLGETIGYTDLQDMIYEMGTGSEYILALGVLLLYYSIFEIVSSRTIGKYITQTIVVDEFGEKPTVKAILIRTLCRLIPLDALTYLGRPEKGWHDSISKTYVVRKQLLDSRKENYNSLDEIGQNL